MKVLFTSLLIVGLCGCAATAVKPGAAKVIVTHQAAPKGCKFLGSVIGEQGGSFTGNYTSNKALQEGALNDMKNKAFDMGGNYVVLENTNAGSTASGSIWSSHSAQTDVTHMGNAYHCPDEVAGN